MYYYMIHLDTAELQPYAGPRPTGSILFKNVNCTGDETKLVHCQTINQLESPLRPQICTHRTSVGVGCAQQAGPGTVPTCRYYMHVQYHNYGSGVCPAGRTRYSQIYTACMKYACSGVCPAGRTRYSQIYTACMKYACSGVCPAGRTRYSQIYTACMKYACTIPHGSGVCSARYSPYL